MSKLPESWLDAYLKLEKRIAALEKKKAVKKVR